MVMGIRVETRFANGSISFRVADRLVKLSKSTIDDLMGLIRPGQFVRGDMVSVFAHYWFNSVELIAGPGNEQKEQWGSKPRWEHTPYLFLPEFIRILGLLHDKDLGALADFARGVEFRNSLAYRNWHRQQEAGGGAYPERGDIETTIASPEQWAEMTDG